MTVSSSSDFNRTRNQIISRSGRIIGATRAGAALSASEVSDFSEALNAMVKRWQATPNMRVWTVMEGTLFPQVDQVKYALGSGSTDHATETYYETAITSDEASGQTILSVDSTTNIAVSDNIGIVVDDGTLHWTTVSSKTSTTVTIASALDDDAAAGNAVFNYTTKLVRPLKIVECRRFDFTSDIETSMSPMLARLDYRALPNKTESGIITQAFYDPQRESLGYLHLWQPPSSVTDLVNFTWHRPIMDFDAADDTPDLPAEWIDAIVYNLALEMATEYKVSDSTYGRVERLAMKYLDDVAGFDREAESIEFQLDMM